MRKTLLLCLLAGLFIGAYAVVPKKVAYITKSKTMDATATTQANDPIIQVLNADPNISLTVKLLTVVTATETISDLATYDVIIVQESMGGGDGMLQPAGALALKTIPKPFIYNKNYALQKTRALSNSASAGAGKEADGTAATGTLLINVETSQLDNDLFKACTKNASNQIQLFNALTSDLGVVSGGIKAINYNSGLTAIPGTLLAQPAVLNAGAAVSVCINDVPAGTAIDGTETTSARGIFLGMNYGAICATSGTNITSDALTIWRNAVYILAGLAVPSTKAVLPSTAVKTIDGTSAIKSVE